MNHDTLRAWWWQKQGLDGSLEGATPAQVLERSGWARSVAGIGPYLTMFARAGTSREDVDAAVKALSIHELPTARGCTYVLPKSEFALGLKVGETFADAPMRVARSLGVTDKEIATLSKAVVKALAKATLDPEGIRAATGDASRSLGEAGKKKGVTTTLPLALGLLQASGEIRRVPVNGRLDQQRYAYTAWSPSPLAKYAASLEDSYTELARRFFRWIGPATQAEFQGFAGIGVKLAKEATAPLSLVPMEAGSDRLLLAEDVDAFRAFKAPKKPQYALVSSLDTIALARRDIKGLLTDADFNRQVLGEKTMLNLSSISDLPNHAILDRGRLIGLWEYAPDTSSIAWTTFGVSDKALTAKIKETEAYVRDQVGDARSFSLDSPKSRQPRISWLRSL